MLKGEGLSFRYGPQLPWLIEDFSISVAPGEWVGLSGPSGRGKTTIGKILAGYLASTTGAVSIDGKPAPRRGYHPVQLIFQHPELAINPRWRIDQALNEGYIVSAALLDALQIDPGWLGRWPHELSGGELQRIAVARAFGPGTRYLIADEMTTMLDANTQAQLWHATQLHARAHRLGVLVISHEQALLTRLCDRVIELDREEGRGNREQGTGNREERRTTTDGR
jgi:peptide/nickel transport system ATP-binding protein/Fe3+-transporting ATPase